MVLEPHQLVIIAIVNVIVMVGRTKIIDILETAEVRIPLGRNFATYLEMQKTLVEMYNSLNTERIHSMAKRSFIHMKLVPYLQGINVAS
jgi:hypothetical protein